MPAPRSDPVPRPPEPDHLPGPSAPSRRTAGILLIIFPTVVIGGVSVLTLLITDPAYAANPLRQDLWRAGHAHAGVLVSLGLIVQLFADAVTLGGPVAAIARSGVPLAAILIPAGYFLSSAGRGATEPNRLIVLIYVGAVSLAMGVLALGVGLLA